MAAGPVGIIGGVFGGNVLPLIESERLEDAADDADGASGFTLSCLCVKGLLSEPLPVKSSQLSFRSGPVIGAAGVVEIELRKGRTGRGCISCFARISGPKKFDSLYGIAAAMAPRSAFGPVGG